jgi:hypothetical protein
LLSRHGAALNLFYGFQEKTGAQRRDRTTDTAIFSRMLYQLSYLGTGSGFYKRVWSACLRKRAGYNMGNPSVQRGHG